MASTTSPITPELLALLRCPATMQPLQLAPAEIVARIRQEQLLNCEGHPPNPALEHALLRTDGLAAYPIHGGLPILLPGAAILLPPAERLSSSLPPDA